MRVPERGEPVDDLSLHGGVVFTGIHVRQRLSVCEGNETIDCDFSHLRVCSRARNLCNVLPVAKGYEALQNVSLLLKRGGGGIKLVNLVPGSEGDEAVNRGAPQLRIAFLLRNGK